MTWTSDNLSFFVLSIFERLVGVSDPNMDISIFFFLNPSLSSSIQPYEEALVESGHKGDLNFNNNVKLSSSSSLHHNNKKGKIE